MGRKSYQTLVSVLCLLASCVKDKPAGQDTTTHAGKGTAYVLCEGNFGSGEATLYGYQPTTDSIYGDLFKSINNQPLGDVLQDMSRIGNDFFLCVNNSDKVVVLDAKTLAQKAIISIPKPRYVLQVNDTSAYVSSLYHSNVYHISLSFYKVIDSLVLPCQNTEGLCRYYNQTFVCTWDTACKTLYRVDPASKQIVQSIELPGYAPQAALLDKEQMLWVLSGNKQKGKPGMLTRLDPSTGNILSVYRFNAEVDALKPCFNPTRDTLYYIEVNYNGGSVNNGIYRMGIHSPTLPDTPFIPAITYQYFWALGINTANDIYVGDPRSFVQKGKVFIYRPDGTLKRTLTTGVGPGHFFFDE